MLHEEVFLPRIILGKRSASPRKPRIPVTYAPWHIIGRGGWNGQTVVCQQSRSCLRNDSQSGWDRRDVHVGRQDLWLLQQGVQGDVRGQSEEVHREPGYTQEHVGTHGVP